MTGKKDSFPRHTMGVFADMSLGERLRYRAGMTVLDVAMWLNNRLQPDRLQAAAEQDSPPEPNHRLTFYRTTNDSGYNVYVFETDDGERHELGPGATVSELQNRL